MILSRFLKITCPRCGKTKIIFSRASVEIKCPSCNYLLTKSRGGKAKVRAKITGVFTNVQGR